MFLNLKKYNFVFGQYVQLKLDIFNRCKTFKPLMGIVVYNYLVDDSIIDKILKSDFDIDTYMSNQLMEHEYQGFFFEKKGILFWKGVKAWSPMYELIKILDNSEKKVLSELLKQQYYIPETEKSSPRYYYYSSIVKEIWNELRHISIGDIEKSINNPELINKVSAITGYHNNRIERKTHIVMEFFELYKAFYEAQLMEKGIITELA